MKFCVSILLVMVIFAGCKSNKQGNDSNKELSVKVITAEKKEVQDRLNVLGNITPVKEVSVSAEVAGKIKKIYYEEGQRIKEDDIIAELDKEPFHLALKKAQNTMNQAERNVFQAETAYKESLLSIEKKFYDIEKMKIQLDQSVLDLREKERDFKNKKILFQKEGISQSAYKKVELELEEVKSKNLLMEKNLAAEMVGFRDEDIQKELGKVPQDKKERIEAIKEIRTRTEKAKVDIAKGEANKSKLEMEEAQILLRKCDIKSSLHGVLGVKKINEGEQAKTDTPIFVLFATDKVYAEFEINEEDLHKVAQGTDCEITADAYPDKKLNGKITIMSPIVSQKTRTAIVKVKLENNKVFLKPGMFVRGKFLPNKKREVITVPEQCVQNLKGDKGQVFVVKNGFIIKKDILIETEKEDKLVIVRNGLDPQDSIVLESDGVLNEGSKVKVVK